MTSDVVGRDEELALIGDFLDAQNRLPAGLVIAGAAGIGKTTLWRAGIERAHGLGYCVLQASASTSETQLSFAGLGEHVDDVLPRLPSPQRHALSVALLLADPEDEPPDPRTLDVAFLEALRHLAREAPVLLAVDDVQWLDRPSAAALAFTIRRLRNDPIALLVAQRANRAEDVPLELDRAPFSQGGVQRTTLGPLEPRSASPTPARAAWDCIPAADPPPHPGDVGWQSLLCARDRTRARTQRVARRAGRAAPGPGQPPTTRAGAARRSAGCHARADRDRRGSVETDARDAPGSGARRRSLVDALAGARRTGAVPRPRLDPFHSPTPRLGGRDRPRPTSATIDPSPPSRHPPRPRGAAGAADPVIGVLPRRLEAFEWHHDEFLLPPRAVALARSATCLQAFRLHNRLAWGLQFHPEATHGDLGIWLDGWHADPDTPATGLDPHEIRRQTAAKIDDSNAVGRAVVERFLAQAAAGTKPLAAHRP